MKYIATIYEVTSMTVEVEAEDVDAAEDQIWEKLDANEYDLTNLYHDYYEVEINKEGR